ncbi:hypothetical protein DFQ27_000116 [Actinomortierella ambigua]|uniref:Uncharacterized protein n=1 Tax=Actinomortierella ambigua TaxID=1343610 RepID=A0A9P6U996_9FUNG|nr:hypothetical protein DFQ27_000116 [Actinomortierella ambigua]
MSPTVAAAMKFLSAWIIVALFFPGASAALVHFRIKSAYQKAWVRNLPHPFPTLARLTVYDDPRPPFFVWEILPVERETAPEAKLTGATCLFHIKNTYTEFSAAALEKSGSDVKAVGFEPSRWRIECERADMRKCAIFLGNSNLVWTVDGLSQGGAIRLQDRLDPFGFAQTWSFEPERGDGEEEEEGVVSSAQWYL